MSQARIGRRLALLALAALVALACGFPGGGLGEPRGAPPSAREADETARSALADVERYWTANFASISDGERFEPIQGGYHSYTSTDPPPRCGRAVADYQPNAFYCPASDYIAWDAEQLIPQLYNDYGPLLVAVVLAHEYGHAVQARLGLIRQPTIVVEQQADCFAGGWLGDVMAGNSGSFTEVTSDQLDTTVAGILLLRDQPGTSAQAPQAHGNAFDRIRAFQEGVEQGATRCAGYRAGNLPVTEVPFTSREEAASGGDLPYEDTVRLLSQDAQAYWTRAYPQLTGDAWQPLRVVPFDPDDPPECPGRQTDGEPAISCPAAGYVAFDGVDLGPSLHRRIGDNAVGMLLAGLFAQAAQERRGASVEGREGQLAVDCLAGSWAFDLLHRDDPEGIRLSPGDLDEAVAALVVFGRAADDDTSAFDRIAAFRNGVLKGLPACR